MDRTRESLSALRYAVLDPCDSQRIAFHGPGNRNPAICTSPHRNPGSTFRSAAKVRTISSGADQEHAPWPSEFIISMSRQRCCFWFKVAVRSVPMDALAPAPKRT